MTEARAEEGLPESLRELSDVIGLDATLMLVRHFGGIRLYIPQDASGHSLADVLGTEALELLVQVYGGDRLEVPKGAKVIRDEVLRRRYNGTDGTDGAHPRDLAREFFLTERQVRRILNEG